MIFQKALIFQVVVLFALTKNKIKNQMIVSDIKYGIIRPVFATLMLIPDFGIVSMK